MNTAVSKVNTDGASGSGGRKAGREMPILLGVLFFFSGATSLVYEVVWTRLFGLVFGNTVYAVSTVLAAFFGGLALGSFLLGRLSDRKARVLMLYALLEAGIGLLACLTPVFLHLFDGLYAGIFRGVSQSMATLTVIRFLLSFITLVVPTTLMGATLPVLTRFTVRRASFLGRQVGILYGINTLGAVTGTVVAGFLLMEYVGVTASIYVAAIVNLAIAGLAVLLSIRMGERASLPVPPKGISAPVSTAPPATQYSEGIGRLVLIVTALSGLAALAYEVLWTRLLVYVLDTTIYAFAIMLTVFLVGLALGSLIFGPLADRRPRCLVLFAVLEGLVGLTALASLHLLSHWDSIDPVLTRLVGHSTLWRWNLQRFVGAAVIMLVPTTLLGGTFPLAVRIFTRSLRRVGGSVGELYAANTLGGVVGSVLAGFVLLPLLGTEASILVMALVNVLLAITLWVADPGLGPGRKIALAVSFLLVLGVGRGLLPSPILVSVLNLREQESELIYYHEGTAGTVTVHQYPGFLTISVNGINVAGTDMVLRTTQKLQGHIPCLLHPHPKKAMQIGFGSGETSRVVLMHGVQELDAVEICGDVIEAAPHFSATNASVFQDPRFNAIIMDGKNFARLTDEKYDLIMNDSVHPALSGNASLYTREHFQACRDRLNEDGLMSTWFPLFGLKPADFAMIIRTFREVFPHCTLWVANNCANRHALLVGWKKDEPFTIDWSRMAARMAEQAVSADLAEVNLGDIEAVLDCFMLDEEAIARFTEGALVSSDEHPYLEFRAPKVYPRDPELLATNLENLARARTPVFPLLRDFAEAGGDSIEVKQVMDRYFAGTTEVLRGIVAEIRGVSEVPEDSYRMALELNPDDRDATFLLQEKVLHEALLTQRVADNPDDVNSRIELARLYLRSGRYEEALESFREAGAMESDDASLWYDLGVCYAALENLEDAAQAYRKAAELDPSFPEPHVNLGTLYHRQGRFEDAVKEYETALRLAPDHVEANYNLGVAYAQRGIHKDAIPYFEKALEQRPTYLEAHYNLGICYAMTGDLPRAVEEWRATLELDPDNQPARANLARALQMLGQSPPAAGDSAKGE